MIELLAKFDTKSLTEIVNAASAIAQKKTFNVGGDTSIAEAVIAGYGLEPANYDAIYDAGNDVLDELEEAAKSITASRPKTAEELASDLRDELKVAARAAMQYGATSEQIETIIFLAKRSGDFNVMGGSGRLTRGEAENIIRWMEA